MKIGSRNSPRRQWRSRSLLKSDAEAASSEELEFGADLHTLDAIERGFLVGQNSVYPDPFALWSVADLGVDVLCAAAARLRDNRADANAITFSPKVFIPLTRVCRDFCGYCTFATGPAAGRPVYMTVDEVRSLKCVFILIFFCFRKCGEVGKHEVDEHSNSFVVSRRYS